MTGPLSVSPVSGRESACDSIAARLFSAQIDHNQRRAHHPSNRSGEAQKSGAMTPADHLRDADEGIDSHRTLLQFGKMGLGRHVLRKLGHSRMVTIMGDIHWRMASLARSSSINVNSVPGSPHQRSASGVQACAQHQQVFRREISERIGAAHAALVSEAR